MITSAIQLAWIEHGPHGLHGGHGGPIQVDLHQSGGGPISSALAAIIGGAIVAASTLLVEWLRQKHERKRIEEEQQAKITQSARSVYDELIRAFSVFKNTDTQDKINQLAVSKWTVGVGQWEAASSTIALLPGKVWADVTTAYQSIEVYNSAIQIGDGDPDRTPLGPESIHVICARTATAANSLKPHLDLPVADLVPNAAPPPEDATDNPEGEAI